MQAVCRIAKNADGKCVFTTGVLLVTLTYLSIAKSTTLAVNQTTQCCMIG
jgi:hypothetical protein